MRSNLFESQAAHDVSVEWQQYRRRAAKASARACVLLPAVAFTTLFPVKRMLLPYLQYKLFTSLTALQCTGTPMKLKWNIRRPT